MRGYYIVIRLGVYVGYLDDRACSGFCEDENHFSLTHALMGNYPVRAFASFDSFKCTAKMGSGAAPDLMIVDLDICDCSASRVYNVIDVLFNDVTVLFVTNDPDANSVVASRGCLVVKRPTDVFSIKSLIENIFAHTKTDQRYVEYGNLIVNIDQSECFVRGHDETISLTPREFKDSKKPDERPGNSHDKRSPHRKSVGRNEGFS